MKYVLINGSAHKGNTWKVAMSVKEHLLQIDREAEFEEIHLTSLQIPFCLGCSQCFRKGQEFCPHHEVIAKVLEAMDQADGVIFASTTYFMRETAILKNFFDHLCFLMHRPYFFHSKAMIITTTGGVGANEAAKSIASTLRAIGFNYCYLLALQSCSWNAYEPNDKAVRKSRKVALQFYQDVASKKPHPVRTDLLIPYNLFRGMSLAYVKGTQYETEDGNYWTDPGRAKFVYDPSVPLPLLGKPIGHIFYMIGKYAGKKISITYKK